MSRSDAFPLAILFPVVLLCFSPDRSSAQGKAPPAEMIKGAYQEILRTGNTSKDGQLTLQECMEMWKDKAKVEEN